MSGGAQMTRRYDRTLRIAQVLAAGGAKFSAVTSEQICAARHLAHSGATPTEIAAAVGWDASLYTVRNWLGRLNIRINSRSKHSRRSHNGGETTISGTVGFEFYRPRVRA